jgi:hypothetical protein
MRYSHARGGYVALVSTLIISTLLSLLILNSATDALLARFDTMDYADHLQARALALSCVYAGAFSLTFDPTYQVPDTGIDIFVGDPSQLCHIQSITDGGVVRTGIARTIRASASVRRASVNIEAHLNVPLFDPPSITSWKEMNAT